MPTRPGSLGKRPRTPTFSRCPPPVAVLVVFLNPLAPRLIGSLLLFQLGKKFKTKLMPWGPALRAAQHPAYPARPAPGQPARSREASRARRPTDCTTKRGGRAGCSSLPVYSAARVTEILPTPAFFFGLGAQSKGQQRPDQREPLQPLPGVARATPGSAGSSVFPLRKLGQVPHNLPADPASPTAPRRRTTARGTRKPTARWGLPSRARPRERRAPQCPARPWRGRRRGDRRHPVPASSPPARAPAPNFAGRRSTRSAFTCGRGFAVSRRAPGVDGGGRDALRARIGPGSPRCPPPSTLPGRAVGLAAAAPPRSAGDPRPRWPVRNAGRGSGRQCRLRLRAVCLPPARSPRPRLPGGPPASPPSPSPSKRDRRRPGGAGAGLAVRTPSGQRRPPLTAATEQGERAARPRDPRLRTRLASAWRGARPPPAGRGTPSWSRRRRRGPRTPR